ncbi:hypothetical protein [Streptomyces sp. NPDC047061]|uniref:hypothetical protein n=1 Tax=Streptomyces sp. NPDC047061 TaxID=3154605 RepID=UPI00340086B8
MVLNVARRLLRSLTVLLLVTMGTVALLSLAPGSAASVILGENATPKAVAELNARLGMDRPLWLQYVDWLKHAVTGDLGTSPVTNEPDPRACRRGSRAVCPPAPACPPEDRAAAEAAAPPRPSSRPRRR